MDINLLRSLVTVASLAAFLGIVWWAYGPSRKERFERDALLPFGDDEDNLRTPNLFPLHPSPPPLSRAERGGNCFPSPFGRRGRDEGIETGNVQREMASRPFPERENGKRP